mmetsp:Transcript_52041/g.106086  ORF Transcript_52041/g.106086 Transcript_52041/m.106086 type:complete len:177 (-) Transcript_52041:1738-2268(-)
MRADALVAMWSFFWPTSVPASRKKDENGASLPTFHKRIGMLVVKHHSHPSRPSPWRQTLREAVPCWVDSTPSSGGITLAAQVESAVVLAVLTLPSISSDGQHLAQITLYRTVHFLLLIFLFLFIFLFTVALLVTTTFLTVDPNTQVIPHHRVLTIDANAIWRDTAPEKGGWRAEGW